MSRKDEEHTRALFLLAKAALLRNGDADAQDRASELEKEARSIDPYREDERE